MEKLRLIQCGVGGWGQSWLNEVSSKSPDFEIVALVDISLDTLAQAGRDTGLATDRQFASLEAALAAVPADAVLSVTPPPVHVQHARLAFTRGLHLI